MERRRLEFEGGAVAVGEMPEENKRERAMETIKKRRRLEFGGGIAVDEMAEENNLKVKLKTAEGNDLKVKLKSYADELFEVEEAGEGVAVGELAEENKVKLKSSDHDKLFEVEVAMAIESKLVKDMIEDAVRMDMPIPLPNVVRKLAVKVLAYSKYHLEKPAVPAHEVNKWDAEFIDVDQATHFDLVLATNYVKSKTPEEKETQRRLTEVRLVLRGWMQLQLMKKANDDLSEKEICDVSLYKLEFFLNRFVEFHNKLLLYQTAYWLGDDQNINFEIVFPILAAIEIKAEELIKDTRNLLGLFVSESESLGRLLFQFAILKREGGEGYLCPYCRRRGRYSWRRDGYCCGWASYVASFFKRDADAKRYDNFLVLGSDLKPLTNACYSLGQTWNGNRTFKQSLGNQCRGIFREFIWLRFRMRPLWYCTAEKKEDFTGDANAKDIDVWIDMTRQLTKILCKAEKIAIEVVEKAEFLRPFMEFVTFGEAR